MARGARHRALDPFLHRLWPQAAAALLRPFPARQEQRLRPASARAAAGAPHRQFRRARRERVAAQAHEVDEVLSRPRKRRTRARARAQKGDEGVAAQIRSFGRRRHLSDRTVHAGDRDHRTFGGQALRLVVHQGRRPVRGAAGVRRRPQGGGVPRRHRSAHPGRPGLAARLAPQARQAAVDALSALPQPRQGRAAQARPSGRARHRDLADLDRGAGRPPRRPHRPRQGLCLRGTERRQAVELQERAHGVRAVPPRRSARSTHGHLGRRHQPALRRRTAALSPAADHSAQKSGSAGARKSPPLVPTQAGDQSRRRRAIHLSTALAVSGSRRKVSSSRLGDFRGVGEGMNTQFWLTQAFNGISYGALLFLVGSGLSLIFGVMRIVNLSHGSYFLLGGYVALSVIWTTGSWLLAIPVAALTIAVVGVAMERVFLRPLGFDPLRQVLLTVGFAFLFQQAALDIWTGNNFDINPPDALTKSIVVGGLYLPLYRIFMIGTALIIGVILWLVMEKTRMGAAVRATVDDAQMARGVGIDTSRISMLIFALGAFLAALGGVIGGAFLGIYPGLDFEMLPIAFAVVIIGGMGSLGGAAIGALIVGLADNFGKALFPEVSYFTLYAPMALILAVKPTGLFGRE